MSGSESDSFLFDSTPERPALAFALSLVAGLLIIIDGAIVLWAASAVSSVAVGPAADAASGLLGLIGGFAVLIGLIVAILAILLWAVPESHVGIGITILVFSLVSFIVGGGFFLGAILGIVGGILGIVFDPGTENEPLPPMAPRRRPRGGSSDFPPAAPQSRWPTPPLVQGLPRIQRPSGSSARPFIGCPKCGEVQPTANAIHCRKCGAELLPPRSVATPS